MELRFGVKFPFRPSSPLFFSHVPRRGGASLSLHANVNGGLLAWIASASHSKGKYTYVQYVKYRNEEERLD